MKTSDTTLSILAPPDMANPIRIERKTTTHSSSKKGGQLKVEMSFVDISIADEERLRLELNRRHDARQKEQ